MHFTTLTSTLTTLLLLTPLITASPIPKPQFTVPSTINPSQGPAFSTILFDLNKFLGRFSTKPGILAITEGAAPPATTTTDGTGETTVDGGKVELKPVEEEGKAVTEGGAEDHVVTEKKPVQEGDVEKLRPVEGEKKPVLAPAPVPVTQEGDVSRLRPVEGEKKKEEEVVTVPTVAGTPGAATTV